MKFQDQAMIWMPFVVVIVLEHFILSRIYGKQSSLQRLFFQPSSSAKSDIILFLFNYIGIQFLASAARFFVLPGIAFLALSWLMKTYEFQGLVHIYVSENIWIAGLIWLLVLDLSSYLAHIMMHKVPFLWSFHKIHHAATEMNIVTGSRLSIAEVVFNDLIKVILLTALLGIENPGIAALFLVIRRVIDLIQHSDLPWDFGPVGYLIASPRYHRLHHSSHPDDFDTNYGNIFSFWDYLFGTVSSRFRSQPAIADDCELGLDCKEDTHRYNDWRFALLRATFLEYAYLAYRWILGSRGKVD